MQTTVPFIPETAPFSAEQRQWLNGFLAGLFSNVPANTAPVSQPALEEKKPLLVMFGSQTGNAENLAKKIAAEADTRGFAPRVLEMAAHETVDLQNEPHLFVVTSTWGDGEPPDNAAGFWERLKSADHPPLSDTHFSVLALGDSNYEDFCGCGRRFDERLAELGAKRVHDRADCDTDFDAPAKTWIENALAELKKVGANGTNGTAVSQPKPEVPALPEKPAQTEAAPVFSRKNPFPARLLVNRKLTGEGSAKDTRHFEISLAGSGLSYEVGDALGVIPANCPELVAEMLVAMNCNGEEAVATPDGAETSLRSALLKHYDLRQVTPAFLQHIAERGGDGELRALSAPERAKERDAFLWGREPIDLLLRHPQIAHTAAELVKLFKKLQPRLYSISSSPKAHSDEVHLTVARVGYDAHGRTRKGLCSAHLADRLTGEDAIVPVFVQVSKSFRLPVNGDTPIIMVGPGTGIAPFRAFLEERRATGATGGNWLFFGDQHAATDFLYREELEAMRADGFLTRLDTAFSRDQEAKLYVQHRMKENARELFEWLEKGAHFYVCGDASRMAKDVDAALHEAIQTGGGKTADEAKLFVEEMKTGRRYQRDVY